MKLRGMCRIGDATGKEHAIAAALVLVMLAAITSLAPCAARAGHQVAGGEEQVERGEAVYGTHCARCHGADLAGERFWDREVATGATPAPPLDGDGHVTTYSNGNLFLIIQEGVDALGVIDHNPRMPEFRDILTAEEIWATIAYITSTWPQAARDDQHPTHHFPFGSP